MVIDVLRQEILYRRKRRFDQCCSVPKVLNVDRRYRTREMLCYQSARVHRSEDLHSTSIRRSLNRLFSAIERFMVPSVYNSGS
jgi:hypothetical protein